MRRLLFFAGGVACGLAIGATLALLLAPASGDTMRSDAQNRFDNMMTEARLATERRRRELESQLTELTAPQPVKALK